MTPPDLPDFDDDYERVDFAPEPKRTRNGIVAVMAAAFVIAGVAGVWAALT